MEIMLNLICVKPWVKDGEAFLCSASKTLRTFWDKLPTVFIDFWDQLI